MIEDKIYEELLSSGLTLDHYFLLCNIKNSVPLITNRRVGGFKNLLIKRGYLDVDSQLTEKGIDLVQSCEDLIVEKEPTTKKKEFLEWVEDVRLAMVSKLEEITGKKQVLGRMKPHLKGYYFLPNSKDLASKLEKVMLAYKIKDRELIEKKLVNYVETCANKGEYFPLVKYYIYKEGVGSQLVDSLDAEDEESIDYKSNQKFV